MLGFERSEFAEHPGWYICNYTSSEGGAIYNAGAISFAGTSTFTDNYVEKNGKKTSNAIHNTSGGTINFNSGNIVINDAIAL